MPYLLRTFLFMEKLFVEVYLYKILIKIVANNGSAYMRMQANKHKHTQRGFLVS